MGQNALSHTKPETAASGLHALEKTAPNGRDADAQGDRVLLVDALPSEPARTTL
jgi:hypothetical protein